MGISIKIKIASLVYDISNPKIVVYHTIKLIFLMFPIILTQSYELNYGIFRLRNSCIIIIKTSPTIKDGRRDLLLYTEQKA